MPTVPVNIEGYPQKIPMPFGNPMNHTENIIYEAEDLDDEDSEEDDDDDSEETEETDEAEDDDSAGNESEKEDEIQEVELKPDSDLQPISTNDTEIKVINIANEINRSLDIENLEEVEVELDLEENDDDEPTEQIETLHEPYSEQPEVPAIQVSKLDETMSHSLGSVVVSDETKKEKHLPYHKMLLPDLKALVITKGLVSDTSKLKKNDLIKLLEKASG
jgi:hypothetical protein